MDLELCNGDRQRERCPNRAYSPCDTTGGKRRHPVSQQHTTETESHVTDEEPNAERVMRNEPHVPRVGQKTSRSS